MHPANKYHFELIQQDQYENKELAEFWNDFAAGCGGADEFALELPGGSSTGLVDAARTIRRSMLDQHSWRSP